MGHLYFDQSHQPSLKIGLGVFRQKYIGHWYYMVIHTYELWLYALVHIMVIKYVCVMNQSKKSVRRRLKLPTYVMLIMPRYKSRWIRIDETWGLTLLLYCTAWKVVRIFAMITAAFVVVLVDLVLDTLWKSLCIEFLNTV